MAETIAAPEIESTDQAPRLPHINSEISPVKRESLAPSHYRYFQNAGMSKLVYDSQNQPVGVDEGAIRLPIDSLEKIMATDCDTLAGIYDGTITESREKNKSPFLEGKPRSSEPVNMAVYLDKSARPVAAMMRALWPSLSDGQLPDAYFANIDKESYLRLMGFGQDSQNIENVPLESISLDLINSAVRRDLVLRLRAMYVAVSHRDELLSRQVLSHINAGVVPIDQPHPLQSVMDMPTVFSGQHIAVIDEVKSSGATLLVADLLFREAFPDAVIEPVYWSVPSRLTWNAGREFANAYVPVWYDRTSAYGRGGVGGVDESRSHQAANKVQQVGAPLLSTVPINNEGQRRNVDQRSIDVRHDIDLFAQRFKAGMVRYEPSHHRTADDYEQRLSAYYPQ